MSRPGRLDLGRAAQRLGRQEALAVEHAAAGERGVHARQRARGEAAVDRGDRGRRAPRSTRTAGRTPGTMNVSIAGRSHASRARPDREALGAFRVAEPHDELGDAVALVGRRADRHAVEAERLHDLGLRPRRARHPGDAPDHLADEEAVRDAVIAVARARRRSAAPPRRAASTRDPSRASRTRPRSRRAGGAVRRSG